MRHVLTDEDRARGRRSKTRERSSRGSIQNQRSDLRSTQEAAIRDRASQIPKTCLRTYLLAMRGKSLRASINAFCMECVGWDRREVALCTALACPHYPYRPFKETNEAEEEAAQ